MYAIVVQCLGMISAQNMYNKSYFLLVSSHQLWNKSKDATPYTIKSLVYLAVSGSLMYSPSGTWESQTSCNTEFKPCNLSTSFLFFYSDTLNVVKTKHQTPNQFTVLPIIHFKLRYWLKPPFSGLRFIDTGSWGDCSREAAGTASPQWLFLLASPRP